MITAGELASATIAIIVSLVGGSWLLASKISDTKDGLSAHISELAQQMATHAAGTKQHKEVLDDHEKRIRNLEFGDTLREIVQAVQSISERKSNEQKAQRER